MKEESESPCPMIVAWNLFFTSHPCCEGYFYLLFPLPRGLLSQRWGTQHCWKEFKAMNVCGKLYQSGFEKEEHKQLWTRSFSWEAAETWWRSWDILLALVVILVIWNHPHGFKKRSWCIFDWCLYKALYHPTRSRVKSCWR